MTFLLSISVFSCKNMLSYVIITKIQFLKRDIMKKIFCLLMITGMLFAMVGCTKTLHCDNCNKEIKVSKSSNMEEDWSVYCDDCQKELLGDKADEK